MYHYKNTASGVRHLKRTFFLTNNNQYEQVKITTTKSQRALRSRVNQSNVCIYHCMRCFFSNRHNAKLMRNYLVFIYELTYFIVVSIPLAITIFLTATLLSKIKNF
jgi:hypothetical protein